MRYEVDAEGFEEGVECPQCGGFSTITFRYVEGYEEYECPDCGYRSEDQSLAQQELDELTRYNNDLLEGKDAPPVIPRRSIQA